MTDSARFALEVYYNFLVRSAVERMRLGELWGGSPVECQLLELALLFYFLRQ